MMKDTALTTNSCLDDLDGAEADLKRGVLSEYVVVQKDEARDDGACRAETSLQRAADGMLRVTRFDSAARQQRQNRALALCLWQPCGASPASWLVGVAVCALVTLYVWPVLAA